MYYGGYSVAPLVPETGDRLSVARSLYTHYGVSVGRGYVVHNEMGRGVQLASFDEFAQGRPVRIEMQVPFHLRGLVRQRAMDLIGTPYNLLAFNCEHFVSYVYTGKAESRQVRSLVAAGIAGLVILAASG